jgi:hypothetical protein
MIINDPALLAEVTAAFHEYERALMEDDIPAMDALFHDAPTTNRYGVGEVLYGIEEIREFRKGAADRRSAGWAGWRSPSMATLCHRRRRILPRGQRPARAPDASWVKFADGWKVVSAHVSLEGSTHDRAFRTSPLGGGTRRCRAFQRRSPCRSDARGLCRQPRGATGADPRPPELAGKAAIDGTLTRPAPPNRPAPGWTG